MYKNQALERIAVRCLTAFCKWRGRQVHVNNELHGMEMKTTESPAADQEKEPGDQERGRIQETNDPTDRKDSEENEAEGEGRKLVNDLKNKC